MIKRLCTGILISGAITASPLHAFGFTPGSDWGGPTMSWGNGPTQVWGTNPSPNWGNNSTWLPSMNRSNRNNALGWNNNPSTFNPGNNPLWSPFNFGNNNWPTFTMPTISWQNQNAPGWNNYPVFPGNAMPTIPNRVPVMIYQPVVPIKMVPVMPSGNTLITPTAKSPAQPAAVSSKSIPPQPVQQPTDATTIPGISPRPTSPSIPAATVQTKPMSTETAIPATVTATPVVQSAAQVNTSMARTMNELPALPVKNTAGTGDGPVFPDPDSMPPELKETLE